MQKSSLLFLDFIKILKNSLLKHKKLPKEYTVIIVSREKKSTILTHHTFFGVWGGVYLLNFSIFICSLLSDLAKRIYIPRDEISNSEWSVKRGGRILILTVMFSRRIFVVNTIWKKINIENYVWIAKCTLQSSFQFLYMILFVIQYHFLYFNFNHFMSIQNLFIAIYLSIESKHNITAHITAYKRHAGDKPFSWCTVSLLDLRKVSHTTITGFNSKRYK